MNDNASAKIFWKVGNPSSQTVIFNDRQVNSAEVIGDV